MLNDDESNMRKIHAAVIVSPKMKLGRPPKLKPKFSRVQSQVCLKLPKLLNVAVWQFASV